MKNSKNVLVQILCLLILFVTTAFSNNQDRKGVMIMQNHSFRIKQLHPSDLLIGGMIKVVACVLGGR